MPALCDPATTPFDAPIHAATAVLIAAPGAPLGAAATALKRALPGVAVQTMHSQDAGGFGAAMAQALAQPALQGPVWFVDASAPLPHAQVLAAMQASLKPTDWGCGRVVWTDAHGRPMAYGYGAIRQLAPDCMLVNAEVARRWPLPQSGAHPLLATMTALTTQGHAHLVRAHDPAQDAALAAAPVAGPSGQVNRDLLHLMPAGLRTVQEIGGSTGALAHAYKAANPGAHYQILELDPSAAVLAQPWCDRAEAGDIEALASADYARFADRQCWVFADVLEHLRNPWGVLRRIRAVIPDDGCLVLCIPNAQHWSLQLKLALGQFRYENTGLLDHTHLRWFTRITLLEMLSDTGWQLEAGSRRILNQLPEQRDRALEAIRTMARAAGHDPEAAADDAQAFQLLVRAVPSR